MAEQTIPSSRRWDDSNDSARRPAAAGSDASGATSASRMALRRSPGALAGERLGDYQLGPLLGVGGMAEVYRAIEVPLQREVAVKVLAAPLANDDEYANRFRDEARRVGSLSHPHLVPVYHAGEADVQGNRLLYLVMPLLCETLRDLRRREQKLPTADAAWLVLQIAEGLEAAHLSGIVHRDVKPGNVLLDAEGHPMLADFGIARELGATSGRVAPTQSGLIVGTPEYMAPEQLRGAAVDQRADVYALGAVFYELLTGRLPFTGSTPYDLAAHVLNAPLTPPSALAPEIPRAVERVVLRALARDPTKRFQGAGAFAQALQQAISSPPAPPRMLDLSWLATPIWPMWAQRLHDGFTPAADLPADHGEHAENPGYGDYAADTERTWATGQWRRRGLRGLQPLLLAALLALLTLGAGSLAAGIQPGAATIPQVGASGLSESSGAAHTVTTRARVTVEQTPEVAPVVQLPPANPASTGAAPHHNHGDNQGDQQGDHHGGTSGHGHGDKHSGTSGGSSGNQDSQND